MTLRIDAHIKERAEEFAQQTLFSTHGWEFFRDGRIFITLHLFLTDVLLDDVQIVCGFPLLMNIGMFVTSV